MPPTWLIVIYKSHKGQCLPQVLPPSVKAYPDQPKLTDSAQAGTLVGSREQTIAFMADSPGHCAIPALTVIWRDTRTNQPRTATRVAQMLTVLPPPGIAPSAMPAPQARAPQMNFGRSDFHWIGYFHRSFQAGLLYTHPPNNQTSPFSTQVAVTSRAPGIFAAAATPRVPYTPFAFAV